MKPKDADTMEGALRLCIDTISEVLDLDTLTTTNWLSLRMARSLARDVIQREDEARGRANCGPSKPN